MNAAVILTTSVWCAYAGGALAMLARYVRRVEND